MDGRALEILEFGLVKEMAAEFAISGMGREMVRDQRVMTSPEAIRSEYGLVKEMMDAISWRETFPIASLCDIRPCFSTIKRSGAYLDPADLLRVREFLKVAERLKAFFRSFRGDFPQLHCLTERCESIPDFEKAMAVAITPDAEVSTNATPELAGIRQGMDAVSRKIEAVFERIIVSTETRELLQETYITERKGRNVLPVKSEFRNRVPGVVHDVSISGGTVFLEPLAVVSLSNELTELAAREKEEIRRILISLADLLRRDLPVIATDVEVMAKLDMLYGKARFAQRYKCTIPGISADGSLTIEKGRHPLLLKSHEERCVPLNVSLASSDRVLVISGPNAGGKTTGAKTIAVLSLMAQTATPIPADASSVLPIFSGFFADIGDNQDISLGVSTFTSHLGEVKRILESAGSGSLVVLDELGTATDPAEGAVLAEAVLEELTQRGAVTIVTSHLPSLKTLHLTREWARSASMGLDPETERPNFILSMDVPGESSGLTIARQLGIPRRIIERACSLMSRQQRDLTQALEAVRNEKQKLVKASMELENARQQVEKDRDDCAARLKSLEAESGKLRMEKLLFRQTVLAEKEKIIRDAKRRIEKMIARLPSRKHLAAAREQLHEEHRQIQDQTGELQKAIEKLAPTPGRRLAMEEIHEGMLVWATNLHQSGRVKAVYHARGNVDIVVDGVVFTVDAAQLAEHPPEETPPAEALGKTTLPRKELLSTELNLIGLRVEEAVGLLDRFINDASLSGVDAVRVIHGYGTGALRKGIRDFLAGHPLVDGFRSEDEKEADGGAVTVVRLK